MSKQIYIDSNGNEIQVSGTVNTADMMPMSGNDSTKVSEAIGDLSDLKTTDKSSIVGAVNEVVSDLGNKADSADVYTKTQIDTSFSKTINQATLPSGNKTIGDIQSWCKTAEKGTYWFTAYMTSPFGGWAYVMVANKIIGDGYAEILLFYNDHIATSFTSTLSSATPTWSTKSGTLS